MPNLRSFPYNAIQAKYGMGGWGAVNRNPKTSLAPQKLKRLGCRRTRSSSSGSSACRAERSPLVGHTIKIAGGFGGVWGSGGVGVERLIGIN